MRTFKRTLVFPFLLALLSGCAQDGQMNPTSTHASTSLAECRVGEYAGLQLRIADAAKIQGGQVHIKVKASWVQPEAGLNLDGIEHVYLRFLDSHQNVVLKRSFVVAFPNRFLDRLDLTHDVFEANIEVPVSATFVELALGQLSVSSFIQSNVTR